jgi:hypothetical protein
MLDREQAMILLQDEKSPVSDGYDDAIIGVALTGRTAAVYDYDELIGSIMEKEGMSHAEAMDWYEFNMTAHIGDQTPIVIDKIMEAVK